MYFVPGELGIGLVEGYDSMGFEMSKPRLRAELEKDLQGYCDILFSISCLLSDHWEASSYFRHQKPSFRRVTQYALYYFLLLCKEKSRSSFLMCLLYFRICDGTKDPKVVLQNQIQKYREVFRKAVEQVITGFISIYFFMMNPGFRIERKYLLKKYLSLYLSVSLVRPNLFFVAI